MVFERVTPKWGLERDRGPDATGHHPKEISPPSRLPVFFSRACEWRPLAAHGEQGEVDGVQAFGQIGVVSVFAEGHLQLALGRS